MTQTIPTPDQTRIGALQTRLGLSIDGMATYLGVPRTTVVNWIMGRRKPGAAVLRLLDLLGTLEVMAPDVHKHLLPTKGEK